MVDASTEKLNEFQRFIDFVKSIAILDEQFWNTSIGPGKWTVKEIIAHIMLWDKYFLEEAIEKIATKRPLTVKHLDFDTFNENAMTYSRNIRVEELVLDTIRYRAQIIDLIRSIPEEDIYFEHIDGDGNIFTINEYLKGFIAHDQQHQSQIESLLHQYNIG
ncbi:DinB family protein [Paenibacillus tarimensis]